MYITINDAVGKKRIEIAYPIKNFILNKEVAIVNVFSDTIRYEFIEPRTLELEESKSK